MQIKVVVVVDLFTRSSRVVRQGRTVEELSTQHFLETKSNELPFMNGRRVEMSKATVTLV